MWRFSILKFGTHKSFDRLTHIGLFLLISVKFSKFEHKSNACGQAVLVDVAYFFDIFLRLYEIQESYERTYQGVCVYNESKEH